MDFIEHDLKTLLANMPTPFLASEIKTLILQLLSAMALCHDNWIVHRDLKTSNLLMNNRGQIKVADFGLARTFGDPLGDMTQLVVTLWYRCAHSISREGVHGLTQRLCRAPELLFGATEYTTAVDMWSIGCIFGELILREPLLPGRGEIDQVNKVRCAARAVYEQALTVARDCTDLQAPRPANRRALAELPQAAQCKVLQRRGRAAVCCSSSSSSSLS